MVITRGLETELFVTGNRQEVTREQWSKRTPSEQYSEYREGELGSYSHVGVTCLLGN